MSAMQRNKGHNGERELANLLREHLGIEVTRNLMQSREGGSDLLGVYGFAVEVKRAATAKLPQWWEQTIKQAARVNQKPVLAYRLDRKDWQFVVRLGDISESFSTVTTGLEWTATISFTAFCQLARENLPDS